MKKIITESEQLKKWSSLVTEGNDSATKIAMRIWQAKRKQFVDAGVDKAQVRMAVYDIIEDNGDLGLSEISKQVIYDLIG